MTHRHIWNAEGYCVGACHKRKCERSDCRRARLPGSVVCWNHLEPDERVARRLQADAVACLPRPLRQQLEAALEHWSG
jgi:hypothetical protein